MIGKADGPTFNEDAPTPGTIFVGRRDHADAGDPYSQPDIHVCQNVGLRRLRECPRCSCSMTLSG
jgi:hypothetical protein